MKNLLKLTLVLVAVSFMATSLKSQQKYAVIIIGDKPSAIGSYAQANPLDAGTPWEEFWNDTYLMWELLIQNGYSNENIYVLYDEGEDYTFEEIDDRYTAGYNFELTVTDYEVNKAEIENVFNGLATGSNSFPQLTQDDFLFVYTFSHGYTTTAIPEDPGVEHTLLALPGYNEELDYDQAHSLSDIELSNYLDNIIAVKKLIIMPQCLSGGFIPELEGDNVIISTAANDYMPARSADQKYYLDIINWNDPPGTYYQVYDEYELYETEHRYRHTEYNLHLLSALKGKMPDNQSDSYVVPDYQDFPLSDADNNTDNIISITEAFDWVILYDSWRRYYAFGHDDPQLSHSNSLADYTSLQYPTLMFENIGPIGGLTVEHRGIIGITKDVHIEATNQLTFLNNADVYLLNDAKLIVDAGATLVLEDNVSIIATGENNELHVNGDLQIGVNVMFTADEGSTIKLYFGDQPINISTCIFHNCLIKSNANPLTITLSNFSNSFVDQTINNINVSNSTFNNSSIIAANPSMIPVWLDNMASITNCDFTTAYDGANSMIEIYGYKNFEINDNTIDNMENPESTYHGVSIHYSGSSEHGNVNNIFDNEIYCSYGFCDNALAGITIYSGIADIQNNYIHLNNIGIQSLNNSQVYILGNENAIYEIETQRIKNNALYQVYASSKAFPIEIHWNAIYSSDNSDCFVFHDVDMETSPPDVDVTWNYWGSDFDADINLCPSSHYIYEPEWVLINGQIALSNAQQLFETGVVQIADSNYSDAKSTFQQVVTSYPEETPATNALKEILYLEPLAGNDFSGLKNWYLTEPVILEHEQLLNLAQNLANKCDEKLENYPDAITWYESIIQNPESIEDSIFAIIDLEHLYWQMGIDTNLRSLSYVGNLSQYVPKSFNTFKNHKDELLQLLLTGESNISEDQENQENQENNNISLHGELSQNIPNPFSEKSTIFFQLKEQGEGTIKVMNTEGKVIHEISFSKTAGLHNIELDMSNQPAGIYYYSMVINGKCVDSKKMVVVK